MTALRILAVEDCAADRAALRIAFEAVAADVDLAFAESAAGALDHLGTAARPHMMIVDVNMPGRSGLELLTDLKKDRALRTIPVWMLSGSRDARDIRAAYVAHACGFLKKPADAASLRGLAQTLCQLGAQWLAFPEMH